MILAFMFLLLYVWRRIYGLEAYSIILEKKLINLRKENKELQGMLNDTRDCSFNEADALLNEIFKPQVKKCTQNSCNKEDEVHIKFVDNEDNVTKKDDYINELSELSELVVMPVDTEKNQDNESVISDINAVNGVYNRKKLTKYNLEKLKEICSGMNISAEGTKNILIDRILGSSV